MTAYAEHVPWGDAPDPATWANVVWPGWVPPGVHEQIVAFWGGLGRKPADYREQHATNCTNAPAFGSLVVDRTRTLHQYRVGHYVHAWNNIGRVVFPDGTYSCPATSQCLPIPPASDVDDAAIDKLVAKRRAGASRTPTETRPMSAEPECLHAREIQLFRGVLAGNVVDAHGTFVLRDLPAATLGTLVFIDDCPLTNWSHVCRYIFLPDDLDRPVVEVAGEWPPREASLQSHATTVRLYTEPAS